MMLALPQRGIARSIEKHNVDREICCDWLEASALFVQSPVSGSEIVDLLVEAQIYERQSYAWELFDLLCDQIRRRQRILGEGYPLEVRGRQVLSAGAWRDFVPYSFCLTLSLLDSYSKWAQTLPKEYATQGFLFERLSAEAILLLMPSTSVHQTGWSRATAKTLKKLVGEIAASIGDAVGNLKEWSPKKSNDGGLDVVCFHPFRDDRGGHLAYLVQCASGGNWTDKLHTPNLDLWGKLIDFAVRPRRGFSMPFTLPDKEFRQHALLVQGMFLDRYRLLAPGYAKRDWLSAELTDDIRAWLTPRLSRLPTV